MAKQEQNRVYHLLLVDDNPADLSLLGIAFRECSETQLESHRLGCPKDIVSYLYGQSPYAASVRPDLSILDYHMATDGGAALSLLKGNPDVQQLPVIVLTGSENPSDIADVYYRHANACYQKPRELDDLLALAQQITTHWLRQVILPIQEDVTNIHPQRWKNPQPAP